MPDILILQDGTITNSLETGIEYLTSLVIDNLLNTTMTDLYAQDFGTNLKHLPRYNVESKEELTMKFVMTIEGIQNRMKVEQSYNQSTPDEMLDHIQLIDIFEDSPSHWTMRLRVYSVAGVSNQFETNVNKILNQE